MVLRKIENNTSMGIEDVPVEFLHALNSIKETSIPSKIHVTEIPLKPTIAPFCAGITAHTDLDESIYADGKFVLLFNPKWQEDWQSNFRIISMFTTTMTQDLIEENLISQVVWSYLVEVLSSPVVSYSNLAGSITRNLTESFGGLSLKNQQGKIEIRASWSPVFSDDYNVGDHFSAFCEMLHILAGKQLSSPYLNAV